MPDLSAPPPHSLPSYHEPTPESAQRISREEEAEQALTRTAVSRRTSILITALLVVTIATVPVINLAARLRTGATHGPPGAELLALLPSWRKLVSARRAGEFAAALPTAGAIKSAEKDLERESIVSQFLLPRVQAVLTGALHAGNEQAYPGRDGTLFYRPDVDYVIGPPFLDPTRLKHRARDLGLQPNPVRAILGFRDQLAARDIQLLVVPVPVKPSIDGDWLRASAPRDSRAQLLRNPSFADFQKQTAGLVLDLAERLHPQPSPQYLATDTHWQPAPMEAAAALIAAHVPTAKLSPAHSVLPQRESKSITALGDIATMLKLGPAQRLFPPQTITINQVQLGNALWRPSPDAEVLLLGDSFSNIYSFGAMGWGESAGLPEQLSFLLQRPLDCILRNSDGAFATREMLSRELAHGRDRLAGKKLVIWEFAERELAFGDWKLLPLKLGQPQPATFFAVPGGASVEVQATVAALSSVPRPGTVPYKEHILEVHLVDLSPAGIPATGDLKQALAFLWSMQDGTWTDAARLRPGDRVHLNLSPWPGDPAREKINRSELDDPAFQLEEPLWGELLR